MFKKYCLVNLNGDVLVSYKPGQIEMLSKHGFKFENIISYYEKEILKMTCKKALKIMSMIKNEGMEIFLYRRKYSNLYFRVALIPTTSPNEPKDKFI